MLPTKQTLIILTVLSASLLVVVGFTYQVSSNVADKTIIRHHEEIAAEAADTVEIWMAQQKKILKDEGLKFNTDYKLFEVKDVILKLTGTIEDQQNSDMVTNAR